MPSSADDEDSCIKNSCECCGAALAVIVMCLGLVAATAAALTFGIIFLLYEDSQKTAGIILVTIGSFGLLILILLRAAPNFLAVCCAYIWCCECCEKDEEENTEQVNHRPRNWHEVRSSPRPHIPNQAQTVHLPSHPTPYPVGSFFAPEPPQMRNPRHLREPDILTSPPPYTEHPTEPPPSYEEALCNSLAAECALAGGVVTAL